MAQEKVVCEIEKEVKLGTEIKIGNPAVVGLAGFAMSTFLLQMVNLGWMAVGPVIWVMFFFGGMAELIAGFLEFKTGNNFGFCIFTGFGTFWICLGFMLMLGSGPLVKAYPALALSNGVPWFLLGYSLFAFMFFVPAMKAHTVLALIILTLATGLLFLAIDAFGGGGSALKLIGTLDLIGAAVLAWYLMCHVIWAEAGVNLPLGPAWM
jgi:succinate-acetate transporter protein